MRKHFFIIAIIALLLPLYLCKLSTIPTNITGDEGVYLESIYKLLFRRISLSPFVLSGDGSQPAINFYWMLVWIKLFGIKNAILGMRFSTSMFGISAALIFFQIIKKYTSNTIGILTTILLGTSVWYLNFARSGWLNLGIVFFGLSMIYFLQNGITSNKIKLFVFAGIFAGICSYGYFAGKIFPLAAFVLLFLNSMRTYRDKQKWKQLAVFLFSFFLTALPLILTVLANKETYFLRPKTVFILNSQQNILYQIIDVFRGLILFDINVLGKGTENLRYHPTNAPLVYPLVQFLFYYGVFTSLILKRNLAIWYLVYGLSFLFLGILTIDSPNPARLIALLPAIYISVGIGLNELYEKIYRHFKTPLALMLFIVIIGFIIFSNLFTYFTWITSSEAVNARQPAIEYEEFPAWQKYQIQRIKNNLNTISIYEWRSIK